MQRPTHAALWVLSLSALGCSDAAVTKFNTDPTAEVTSHEAGDEVLEGVVVPLRGVVGDPNHSIDSLSVSWVIDGVTVCTESLPDASGAVSCEHTFDAGGGEVLLEARDPEGAVGTDRVTLAVVPNAAPVVVIATPSETGVYYSDALITFSGTVSDAEDAVDELTVTWETAALGVLDLDIDVTSDGRVEAFGLLEEGEHAVRLRAVDASGRDGSDSVIIEVGPPNSPPTCAITAPPDGAVGIPGDAVELVAEVGDVDVPASWLTAAWTSSLDGSLGSSTPTDDGTASLTTDVLQAGTHTLVLTVADERGETCTATSTYVVGAHPTIEVHAPTDGAVFNEGDEVTFRATVLDAEDAPEDLALAWTSSVDGTLSTEPPDSSGAAGFAAAELTAGVHSLTVQVTDTHDLRTEATLEFTINALPTEATVLIDPDPAFTANDLMAMASGSVDPDGSGAVTYRYAWYDDGASTTASTTDTFPAASTVKHHTYRVEVTPTDGTGDGPMASAEVTVDNTPPALSGPALSASTVEVGDTLTCTASATDDDLSDSPTVTYAWHDGSTGPTRDVTVDDPTGATLTCTATADDGDGGVTSASASATVSNSPPTITGLSLTPDPAYTDTVLEVAATVSDANGDAVTVTRSWYVNGVLVASGSATELDGSDATAGFSKGDSVYVEVVADDGTDTTTATTATITISNSPPEAPELAITPSSPVPGDSLWCEVVTDSYDADGDAISYAMTWTVDEVDYATGGTTDTGGLDSGSAGWGGPSTTTWTDDTTDGTDVWSNETWTCTATPNDGDDDGDPASVSVDTNCDDASEASCPGLDCLDILTSNPSSADGIYWIDPTGADAYEVYCDMTTDGGGWTLVMKAVNDNYLYVDTVWTSTGLDNETDLDLTTSGTAKYQSYNEVPFTELRSSDNTVLSTDLTESFTSTQTSALAFFSGSGTVLDSTQNSYFDGRAPAAHQAWGCSELNRYGFNLADALGCTYLTGSTGYLCDHNGGARWGNRTNQYYCSTCGELHGQGWAAYACGNSSTPTVDTGPIGSWVYAINELMWVR